MAEYAHPEVLVDTEWVAQHLNDPNARLLEVDVDTSAYETGHIPGAVGLNWKSDLETALQRDVASKEQLENLLSNAGVSDNTTIVVYGDNNNWFATYAFWLLKYYGHQDVRVMNGGRAKWVGEGRSMTTDVPQHPRGSYRTKNPDPSIRALRDEMLQIGSGGQPNTALVDVRSPREFSGELLAPENLPQEGSQRGGHIPGAKNIVWSQAMKEDNTFKSADELKSLYEGQGVTTDKEVVAYCRIGERSSHTWFVLKYLLGYPNVRNYDGSWTEYGSLVGAPVEK
jgi:thiosulfate/3-mercaptopyruvate sulfurtransferase